MPDDLVESYVKAMEALFGENCGSILSHDHFQGGGYVFAMAKACAGVYKRTEEVRQHLRDLLNHYKFV